MNKRGIAVVLVILLLTTTIGCSKNIEGTNQENTEIVNQNKESEKGGYVEELIKVSDDLEYISGIVKLENGNLIIWGSDKDFNDHVFISDDNGISWTEKKIQHLTFEESARYIAINVFKNGDILVAYLFDNGLEQDIKYGMVNGDGEVKPIELGVQNEIISETLSIKPTDFISLSNGDLLYPTATTNEIVQVDGISLQERFRYPSDMYFGKPLNIGNKLIISSMNTINEYDMNTGELINILEDLENKIKDNVEGGMPIDSQSDKKLYYYSLKGLYVYDLDKNESKLLIDDSKYITDPNSSVDKLIELEEDSFLTVISNPFAGATKLVKYSYDPNYVKVDNSDITIYSLTENEKLRNRITKYEADNPDIEVKYEVGVSSNSGTQISDAIKTLNTEIMAGKGPDIILLDGLPVDSLVENKLLADISDIVSGNDEKVFEGIVNSYKIDGNIYQLPLGIKVPMLIGNKDVISKINDMDSLLSVIKESAKASDNRIFANFGTPEDLIASLYCIYENNWITDREINKENLTKFMNVAKEIYNISKEKDDIFWGNQMEEMGIDDWEQSQMVSTSNMDICPGISVREVIYSKEKPLLGYGSISSSYDIENIVNMKILKDDMDYKMLTKDNKNLFVPYNNIAINKNTKNLELSKDIIKKFIEENASNGAFTIYKTSLINSLKMNEDSDYDESNNHYVKFVETDIDGNGNRVEYPQYWANESEINEWVEEIDKLNTERTVNITVLNEVATQFNSVIEGSLDVKKAVDNVIKKLEIYLAE